jgi:general stress protein YciG
MAGPIAGSEGARRIAEAHSGSHEHDKHCGFAANPELAREAGRRGGERVREKYGKEYYKMMGRTGGTATLEKRGKEYFATIARIRWDRARRERKAEE